MDNSIKLKPVHKKIIYVIIAILIVWAVFSEANKCKDCGQCGGSGKVYTEVTGEVSCPDCAGDGCSSDGTGDTRSGAEIWEEKYGK
jgi:hypothetical protein